VPSSHDITDFKSKGLVGIIDRKLRKWTQRQLPDILPNNGAIIGNKGKGLIPWSMVHNETQACTARIGCLMADHTGLSNHAELLIMKRQFDGTILVLLVNSGHWSGNKIGITIRKLAGWHSGISAAICLRWMLQG
jgi:hypothetical protein